MQIKIEEARSLATKVLQAHGLSKESASVVVDVLIDAHCTGHTFAGLPRIPVLLDSLRKVDPADRGRIEVTKETDSTGWIDGHGNLGYLASQKAIELGIEKSRTQPVVVVGAHNAHYSGRLGFYAEQAAAQGIVVIHVNSTNATVTAPGGSTPVFGTNPFCASFPTSTGPMTIDFGTAAITQGEVFLSAATGKELSPGVAVDKDGQPTTDAKAAAQGAILPWGGHKGFGLSLTIAALGILAGGATVPVKEGNDGFIFVLLRADMFLDEGVLTERIDELVAKVRESSGTVRLPGENSAARRRQTLADGVIDVPDEILDGLRTTLSATRDR